MFIWNGSDIAEIPTDTPTFSTTPDPLARLSTLRDVNQPP